ncbi:DUF2190 family protein [Acidimangrovimonas sediminis]|uniref:DUF2190 family protein n=1 Tax=Acidimangrovimonas sediminis TaxID=2056283 RepID=UPI000C803C14|nr:DUF2190 family protein [Acidimangrovimonas sediminis]
MQYFNSVLSDTLTATSTFDAYQAVDFNDAQITAEDAAVKAISLNPATEVGLDVAGMLLGTVRMKADGAVAKGDRVSTSATAGSVKTLATPANDFATALTAAADGEYVTIFVK